MYGGGQALNDGLLAVSGWDNKILGRKHFKLNLNSILSVLAGNFNLISRDIILQSYWLMFLHRQFIFTDEAYSLGLKFTGAVQSLLSSDDH